MTSLNQWKKPCGNSSCVEIRFDGASVFFRDSKHPTGPELQFTPDEWEAFWCAMNDENDPWTVF